MADQRRCIGSARFGIEAHEAPVADFPVQLSHKDGLGRMCKVHWNAYTAGLARDAKARKSAEPGCVTEAAGTKPEPSRMASRAEGKAKEPIAEIADAGNE